eukprot:7905560-Ditylum_brightwellii.AAC.1
MGTKRRVLEHFRGNIDEEVISAVMDDYKINEEDYTMLPYPPTWDGVYDMDNQNTAPMHTLGPDVKLDWCEVLSIDTENFGGW